MSNLTAIKKSTLKQDGFNFKDSSFEELNLLDANVKMFLKIERNKNNMIEFIINIDDVSKKGLWLRFDSLVNSINFSIANDLLDEFMLLLIKNKDFKERYKNDLKTYRRFMNYLRNYFQNFNTLDKLAKL